MTQLYVGNLSVDADKNTLRTLFSRYGGVVGEILIKNGYALLEFQEPCSAETAMRDLNGSDVFGHPMIVEPSHQQKLSSRRKPPCGRVEVMAILPPMTLQQIEQLLQVGSVLKIIATFENQECAQRAAATYAEEHCTPRILHVKENEMNGMRNGCKRSPGVPGSPSKNFPLRILVPTNIVGANHWQRRSNDWDDHPTHEGHSSCTSIREYGL